MRLPFWIVPLLPLLACSPQVNPGGPPVQAPQLIEDAIIAADGLRLPLRVWQPEGPPRFVILALHGLNDYSLNFMALSAPLLTRGGAIVYAYDQRGFGDTPRRGVWAGTETLLADARAGLGLLRARHPGLPLVLLGESMGGAEALVLAAGPERPEADGIVATTPALWSRSAMRDWMVDLLWFGAHAFPLWGFYGTAPGIVASSNNEALRRFGEDPLTLKTTRVDMSWGVVGLMDAAVADLPRCCRVPTLVLTGARDTVVPRHATEAALAAIPPGAPGYRRIDYADGWHLLLRDRIREKVAADILAWMEGLRPAPAVPAPPPATSAVGPQ
jgi:acylglycerol lipase